MQPDSTLLKRAKGVCPDSVKACQKIIGQYWDCIPGVWGEVLDLEWGRKAIQVAQTYIREYEGGDFETELAEALYKAFQNHRYNFRSTFYDKESPTDPDTLTSQLPPAHVEDNTEYGMDYQWIKGKVSTLLQPLSPSEIDIIHHEFFMGLPAKDYYEKKNITKQTYSETRARAFKRLRDDPQAQWVWGQAKDVFDARRYS